DFSAGGLTNASDGVININLGSGGARQITGNITNQGTLNVQAATDLSIVGAKGLTFNQQAGSINATGAVDLNQGAFNYTGGTINGTVRVVNGTIASSNAGVGTVISSDHTVLVNNSDPNATVWVQGSNAHGDSVMGLSADAENHGVVLMQSVDSSWNS